MQTLFTVYSPPTSRTEFLLNASTVLDIATFRKLYISLLDKVRDRVGTRYDELLHSLEMLIVKIWDLHASVRKVLDSVLGGDVRRHVVDVNVQYGELVVRLSNCNINNIVIDFDSDNDEQYGKVRLLKSEVDDLCQRLCTVPRFSICPVKNVVVDVLLSGLKVLLMYDKPMMQVLFTFRLPIDLSRYWNRLVHELKSELCARCGLPFKYFEVVSVEECMFEIGNGVVVRVYSEDVCKCVRYLWHRYLDEFGKVRERLLDYLYKNCDKIGLKFLNMVMRELVEDMSMLGE